MNSGGGDGTSGGMEMRIAKLEVDVDYIKRDVGELKADLRAVRSDVSGLKVDFGRLDERVKNLPGKGFIVSTSMLIIGLLTAIIVFGDRLKTMLGVVTS